MGRHHAFEPHHFLDGGLEFVEAPRPRVRFVATDQRRPLFVAHRARPAVGEQIDEHVVRGEIEDVVPCRFEGSLSLRSRGSRICSTSFDL